MKKTTDYKLAYEEIKAMARIQYIASFKNALTYWKEYKTNFCASSSAKDIYIAFKQQQAQAVATARLLNYLGFDTKPLFDACFNIDKKHFVRMFTTKKELYIAWDAR